MLKLILFVIVIGLAAFGLAWVADKPGTLTLQWLGYEIETSVLVAGLILAALVLACLVAWSFIRFLVTRPAVLSELVKKNREKRGLEALSKGLLAVGAGDRSQAGKYASQAHKLMPGEPLTGLLRAQAAQLEGDRKAARDIFRDMAGAPETEMLGLRGLFLEARRENEIAAARQFAERAMERNPDLAWSVNALFELQCRASDWAGALRTLDVAQRHKQIEKDIAARRRAVLLTAQAIDAEESDMNRARQLALEALKLAPGLVPAAEIAGRVMASQGDATRAARLLAKAWEISPHPDIAFAYAHTRLGDSPRDRLNRVKHLAQWTPDEPEARREGAIAVATAAVEAREWSDAREALQPYEGPGATGRVCTLMARIEGGETGDQGRVREWLARAVRAPRDPAWMADGYISDSWSPVSPITGELDAFVWKAPVELLDASDPLVIEDIAEPVASQETPPQVVQSDDGSGESSSSSAPARGEAQQLEEEAEIFISPHAPDDPGPDPDDPDEDETRAPKIPAPTA